MPLLAASAVGQTLYDFGNSSSEEQLYLELINRARASSSLTFQSRLRAATSSEHFKLQVREEGAATWQSVYDQTGTNGWGESSFSHRSASLAVMAGKHFRVRFLLEFPPGGGYFPNTTSEFGWYIDAIHFSEVSALGFIASATVAGNTWSFTPVAGSYAVSVVPVISGRDFPGATQRLAIVVRRQLKLSADDNSN